MRSCLLTCCRRRFCSIFGLSVVVTLCAASTKSAGGIYVNTYSGSRHKVTTQDSFAAPGLYEWHVGPNYQLSGLARVIAPNDIERRDSYNSPWQPKLLTQIVPPFGTFASGVNAREEVRPRSTAGSYAHSLASIKTTPLSFGIPLQQVTVGILHGVVAELEVSATVEPGDWLGADTFSGKADAAANDPFPFTNFRPQDSLVLTSELTAGTRFGVRSAGTARGGFSSTLVATTDIPGMEVLYELAIVGASSEDATDTESGGEFSVRFEAHSALGVDAQAVADSITAAIAFDPDEGEFILGNDIALFDGVIDIPDNVSNFTLYLTHSAAIPEPGSLGLLLVLALTSRRRASRKP